jgi:2-beta-glucuronyltransferase
MKPSRVLILTGQHFINAPRKVDLHFIADALRAKGVAVDFVSWRLSAISRFLKDGRWSFARAHRLNQWEEVEPGLEQFIWYTPIHPLNLKKSWLNALTSPLFRCFGRFLPSAILGRLPLYSHILVESGPSPLLIPVIRKAAPRAQIIYHAADRLETINVHPVVISVLNETFGLYDSIHLMAEGLRGDFPQAARVFYLPHGISKEVFDAATVNPFNGPRNAVSVGDMLFDAHAIDVLADAYPEWTFHLFGKKAAPRHEKPNIIVHGEVAFAAIAAFIKFADIGLAPYSAGDNADYLSQSSLKMIQYTYCRLPILAPAFAAAGRPHVCAYDPADAPSICAAFAQAIAYDRAMVDASPVRDWGETVDLLFNVSGQVSPTPSVPEN